MPLVCGGKVCIGLHGSERSLVVAVFALGKIKSQKASDALNKSMKVGNRSIPVIWPGACFARTIV